MKKQATVVMAIQAIIGALAFALSLETSIDQDDIYIRQQFAALWLFPAVLVLFFVLIQIKCSQSSKEKLTELMTPLYLVSTIGLMYLIN